MDEQYAEFNHRGRELTHQATLLTAAIKGRCERKRNKRGLAAPYEKPIHRPPNPTPDHNMTETRATTLLQTGLNRVSPAAITLR
jgi:hypothetical protein